MHIPGPKIISNAFRTSSLSIPAVEAEALGGEDVLGYRTVNGMQRPTGHAVGPGSDDPLDILIREEELLSF